MESQAIEKYLLTSSAPSLIPSYIKTCLISSIDVFIVYFSFGFFYGVSFLARFPNLGTGGLIKRDYAPSVDCIGWDTPSAFEGDDFFAGLLLDY